jgi:hypothetical protein
MKFGLLLGGCLMVLCCVTSQAANRVFLSNSCGDTIVAGHPFTINVAIENDVQGNGLDLGFKVWSPDGGTWAWQSQSNGYGIHKYVTVVPGSRMTPVGTVWDFGFLITEQNVDSIGTDSILVGGVANAGGMTSGPRQDMFQFNFIAGPVSPGVHMFCVDSAKVGEMNDYSWVLFDPYGSPIPIEIGWQSGGACWPVKASTNDNPVMDNTGHIDAFHCVPGSINLTASDPEQDGMQWSGQQLTGQGTFSILYTNGTSNTVTYTPAPDELTGTAGIYLQVHDQYHPIGVMACGLWQDTITVRIHLIGDANNDNAINVGDAVYLINHIFKSGPAPAAWKTGDANCDGLVNVGDAVRLINHVFKGGPSPINACCL